MRYIFHKDSIGGRTTRGEGGICPRNGFKFEPCLKKEDDKSYYCWEVEDLLHLHDNRKISFISETELSCPRKLADIIGLQIFCIKHFIWNTVCSEQCIRKCIVRRWWYYYCEYNVQAVMHKSIELWISNSQKANLVYIKIQV